MEIILTPLQLAFFAAIFGALFSYISNLIAWQQRRKIETIENVAKEFLHLLDILDNSVKNYWSASRMDLNESKEIMLSSSIKTSIFHIQACLKLLFFLKSTGWIACFKKASQNKKQQHFNQMISEIGILSTRGSFEEENREASPQTIMESSNAIVDLRIKFQEFIYQ